MGGTSCTHCRAGVWSTPRPWPPVPPAGTPPSLGVSGSSLRELRVWTVAQAGSSAGRGDLLQPRSITGPRSAVPHSLSLSCGPRSMWSCAGRFLLGVGPLPLQGCVLTRAWPSRAVSQTSCVCTSGCGACRLTLPSLPTPVRPASPFCPSRISRSPPGGVARLSPTSERLPGCCPVCLVRCGFFVAALCQNSLLQFLLCYEFLSCVVLKSATLYPWNLWTFMGRITCCCPISEGPHQGLERGQCSPCLFSGNTRVSWALIFSLNA